MENRPMILDLCGGSGGWSSYYRWSGRYHVVIVDPGGGKDSVIHERVEEFGKRDFSPGMVRGILAAPPCTEFSIAGTGKWGKEGDEERVRAGLDIVFACMDIIERCEPEWWALENPVGRLIHFLGPPKLSFQPYQYGDPWTKRTLIWGRFTIPKKNYIKPDPLLRQMITQMPDSAGRAAERSITPPGFAKAFFEANP